MSGDGPTKRVPDVEPLDDIILGDDDDTIVAHPHPRPSPKAADDDATLVAKDRHSSRPRVGSSDNRAKADADGKGSVPPPDGKKRAKLTLRIPDDEVARPQALAPTPVGGVPVAPVARRPSHPDFELDPVRAPTPLMGTPILAIGSPDDGKDASDEEVRARLGAVVANDRPSVATGVDTTDERGWTPYQPPVEPNAFAPPEPMRARAPSQTGFGSGRSPVAAPDPGEMRPRSPSTHPVAAVAVPADDFEEEDAAFAPLGESTLLGGSGHGALGAKTDPPPRDLPPVRNGARALVDTVELNNGGPNSEEIPVDIEGLASVPDTEAAAPFDDLVTFPRLPAALDSEEIKIEDSDGDRVSDPAEFEVSPEDLVSVESLPAPGRPPPPGGKGAATAVGKYPAFRSPDVLTAPEVVAPTATALMAGAPAAAYTPGSPKFTPERGTAPGTSGASGLTGSGDREAKPPGAFTAVERGTGPGLASGQPAVPSAERASADRAAVISTPRKPQFIVPPVGGLAPPPMTDSAAMRKKTRPWWEELFNDDFIRTMAKVTDGQINGEVNFIEESLGCEAGAMILDLACGTGRHAVELAARGYQVVGFDLSLAMLARASDEAQDRKQKINFVQGDMREMTFEETFDGVYAWNTSFGYFDEEKNAAVVARVHKALKKGGQFLLDVVNRDYIVRQAPSLAWFEGDGCICMDEMTIDFITSRMKVKRTLMMDDGRTKEIEYSIRVYALHELGKMLHDNGFRVAEVSGRTGTPGVFFGCESPRTLILAEKR